MMPPTMPDPQPDPIRATLCRRCGRRPVAGEICAECEARPSQGGWNRPNRELHDHEDRCHEQGVGHAYRALDGGWTAAMHPEGEGYPSSHPGWGRLDAEVRETGFWWFRPLCYTVLSVVVLFCVMCAWLIVGRAGLAQIGLYPAPTKAQEVTR